MNHTHRLVFVNPADLAEHPRNWRTHDADQCAAFDGLYGELGWLTPILYNETTQRILDGHMRRKRAVELGLPTVPVTIVELPAHLEAKALASIDNLGRFAGFDSAAFAELLTECETSCAELAAQFSATADAMGLFQTDHEATDGTDGDEAEAAEESPEPEPDRLAVHDTIYPAADEWGIPLLLPQWSAEGIAFPATLWGTVGASKPMGGLWLNYTRDARLERHWYDPAQLLLSGPVAAIEPNFSTHPQMPRALVLHGIYRKRWIARYWQTRGIRTFVDLSVCDEFRGLNLLGVPREFNAFATRSHSEEGNLAEIEGHWRAAAEHTGRADFVFLVYGGRLKVRELCESRGWLWLPEQLHVARGESLPPLAQQRTTSEGD